MANRASWQVQTILRCRPAILSARNLRTLSTSPASRSREHPQTEKDDIVVESQEYSKSGFDSWAAETEDTAFDKEQGKVAPDTELAQAERESKAKGLSSNPLDASPANKEISDPFEIREGPGPTQSKVAGQESKRTAAPKGRTLPRYDEQGDEGFKGTGSYRTQNQEQPGPKFPSATRGEGKEQWPERTERRKYVGGGR